MDTVVLTNITCVSGECDSSSVFWLVMAEGMDVGSKGAEGAAAAPRTKLYNICQICKKDKIIKNLPETRLR